jgi:hypothetical protein
MDNPIERAMDLIFSVFGIKSEAEKWADRVNLRDIDYSQYSRVYMREQ